jgi:hypothetical protein
MTMNKNHTTNYLDTIIEVSVDTKTTCGTKPPSKAGKKTIAEMQYEMIVSNPYKYTSDDILFLVFAVRNNVTEEDYDKVRKEFFSKGQPCFRASPLPKNYGFGVHSDKNGKVAIFGMETEQYQKLVKDPGIKKVKAMRTRKR